MYKQTSKSTAVRFRRFCRAKWAAYRSMHREVTIGRLAARVADHSLAKAGTAATLCLALAASQAQAQTLREGETRTLDEVQVTILADTLLGTPEPAAVLTADQIKQHNIHSIASLAALLPGVDVRTRGVGDAQADLSMRGGTFDQTALLLGGIDLTDAQTGHHTLDLPLDLTMVQRAELLSPAQMMARGIVAFCGAVNLVADEEHTNRLRAEASGGSHGTANASLLATRTAGLWSITAAAAYHRSDGYMQNTDYRHGSLFLQASRHSDNDDLHLQLGGQAKQFGGQAFYSTTYPDQFEATRTLVASASDLHRFGALRLETSAYGRLHTDRFELFREGRVAAPAWYTGHNHHLGSLAGLRTRAVVPLPCGELVAGAALRREGIRSNVLGHNDSTLPEPFTKSDWRTSATLFAGWHYADRRWNVQAVGLGQYNSRFGADYGLAADAERVLAGAGATGRPLTLRLSAARTFRLPTFTDLYYQSANQRANPALEAEHSATLDLALRGGTRHTLLSLDLFYRAGRDIIDWCRRASEDIWYSMNHTEVDALGFDAGATLQLPHASIGLSWSFCHVAQDAGEWISGSALDYLRHRAALRAEWRPLPRLALRAGLVYRQREGEWVDADGTVQAYGTALLADAGVEYRLGSTTLFAEGNNLLGAEYRDHGGVPMPGRTVLAGIRVGF
ncbi:MAG: TonB-dependent receptor [Bacteroidales bacterium]|nr:TonB-dependent receptor [Bacteroidales bacterium]